MSFLLNLSKLQTVYKECRNPNWDGCGATPISPKTYALAEKLLSFLGAYRLPPLTISSSSSGYLYIEWTHPDWTEAVLVIVNSKNSHDYSIHRCNKPRPFASSSVYFYDEAYLLDACTAVYHILEDIKPRP
jgi:hypothetical protein